MLIQVLLKPHTLKNLKKKTKLYNWTISRIPQKRWGDPNEVSNLICFLLSDLSSYINGTSINVDGGWTGGWDMKVLGLIPSRIGSTRLPAKALLPVSGLPLVVHTYKRAALSKLVNKILICTDSKKIVAAGKKFNCKSVLTSPHHNNGTERITEAYIKEDKKYDFVLDIQGDEPLISPYHIDEVIRFHEKNKDADIILPTLKIKFPDNPNLVKVVTNKKNEVLYLSRAKIPHESKSKCKFFLKHLSIISFKPEALIKFSKAKKSNLEKIEDIELLRALEIGLKIKTLILKGDSFSVDVAEDYTRAKDRMQKDKFYKLYK